MKTTKCNEWVYAKNSASNVDAIYDAETGKDIAQVWHQSDEATTTANGKLIEAAPKLLEELKNLVWNFAGKQDLTIVQNQAIKYAEMTIWEIENS